MTRETFIELVIEQAHRAWQEKEAGQMVDLTICLGRHDRQTGYEISPTVNVLLRGKLEAP